MGVRGLGIAVLGCLVCGVAVAEPVADTMRPTSPGLHHLTFEYEYNGKKQSMPYGLYLPPQIEHAVEEGRKIPLIVFMCGRGSRGQSWSVIRREGPIALMSKDSNFKHQVDYAILRPLVPADQRWENPEMAGYAAEAARRVIKHYPIDTDRVHLMGMSMGGEAVWHVAEAGPELFATVVCIGGRSHTHPQRIAEILKDRTTLIVAGSGDEDFTTGSREMAKVLRDVGADVTYVEVPGRAHDIWHFYVFRPAVYHWMLKHVRGQPLPTDRAGYREILFWALKLPGGDGYDAFARKMQQQFDRFKPYWFVEYSAQTEGVGLIEEKFGATNVFVTAPLNGQFPCRIVHTAKLPAGRKSTLHIEAGHEEGGVWRLVVNVECYRKVKTLVGHKAEKGEHWYECTIDLTPYAGREAFIEILNANHGESDSRATWRRIEIVSEDPSQPEPPSNSDEQGTAVDDG